MSKKSGSTPTSRAMTPIAAARIQSATARDNGGKTPAGSLHARAGRGHSSNTNSSNGK